MMRIFYLATLTICAATFLKSQNGITVAKWVGGVSIPVDIGNCGDDRVFVIEKTGKIRIIQNDKLIAEPFLDIVNKVRSSGNEQGLLGMAFHPDYQNNGLLFVNYTDRGNPTLTVIERYKVTANKNKADSTSGKILMTYVQPYQNHNGGCLKFGKDGYLYIGSGDGGSANDPQNNAQNKKAMLGKMMRIDVDTAVGYKIPPTNPFIKDTSYLKEIWALGMRNPWRYSFDKLTGDLWIADVGQDTWEEIDFEPVNFKGGRNYGWRCYEGNHDFNLSGCNPKATFTFPLHDYVHNKTINECSVTGGYVYRGDKYPSLYGKYIYCDYCSGRIWLLDRKNDSVYTNTLVYDFADNSITTFGEDAAGNLYFADATTSSIYKIGDTCKFSFNIIATDPSCSGLNDGTAKTDLKSGITAKFSWSNGDTVPELKNLSPGTYHLRVIYNQCLTEANFDIHAKPKDTACIKSPIRIEFCEGDSTILEACDPPNGSSYLWYKNLILIAGAESKQLTIKDSGLYQVAFMNSQSCISLPTPFVKIIVHPVPTIPDLKISNDTLIAPLGSSSYSWYLNGLFIGTTTANYWIAVLDGNYTVQVTNSFNCQSLVSLPVVYVRVKTNNIQSANKFFNLHPNPVIDFLVLESKQTNSSIKLNYQIISMENKEIRNERISNFKDSIRINVSDLIPGMYWIKIQSENMKEEKLSFIKTKN